MKHKIGVKGKLLFSFCVFSLIIIILLWLFEIVLLGDVYRWIKIRNVRQIAAEMSGMNEEKYQEFVVRQASSFGICTSVYDTDMRLIVDEHAGGQCVVHNISTTTAKVFYDSTKDVVGKQFQSYLPAEEIAEMLRKSELSYENFLRYFRFDRGSDAFYYQQSDVHDCVFYSLITTNSEGEERFILLSTVIVPVESTIETIQFELASISFVLVLISFVMAFFLSRVISRPIINLNKASKWLPEGKFDMDGGAGYREVEELSSTLSLAAQEISKTDRLRRELIANVSHDLRTPLTLITGYSEAMRDLPGENSPENLQVIIDETNRLSELVSDLLNLSKLEAEINQSIIGEVDLVHLVREIIERYRKMTVLQGFRIDFETDEENGIVLADRIKLSQAIYNLINNAINYCGADKLVFIRLIQKEGTIRFEVHDHGEGIPKEKLPDIWDRYYRVDKNHHTAKVGTGLGLSIVKKVLEYHHAWFGVESKEGSGSCFWFVLPLK